jgi:ankyrin repeat protein
MISTPLHDAVKNRDLQTAKKIIRNNPKYINAKDENGDTPMTIANKNKHREMSQLFLDSLSVDFNKYENQLKSSNKHYDSKAVEEPTRKKH